MLAALTIVAPASAYDDRTPPNVPDRPAPTQEKDGGGLLGPVRVGALAGAGASTHPVDLEAFVKLWKIGGLGVDYGFAPQMRLAGIDLRTRSIGADARLFPFAGSFFLGAGAGWQTAMASVEQVGSATASSYYVTPRMGWLWVFDFGMTFGLDLGATIPVGTKIAVSSDVPRSMLQPQIDRASTLAHMPMPDVKLRVGFLF